jgi:hypothetical protein
VSGARATSARLTRCCSVSRDQEDEGTPTAWIESHQSLSRHRKTLYVTAALGIPRILVIGHLHELWWWALDNADVNGHLGRVSPEILAESAGFSRKKSGIFVNALLDAGGPGRKGFLEIDEGDGGFVLHNWYKYAGRYNDQRERNRVRMQNARAVPALTAPHIDRPSDDTHVAHVPNTSGTRALNGARLSGATGPTGPTIPTGPETPPSPPKLRPGEKVIDGEIYGPPNADGDRWPTGRKA